METISTVEYPTMKPWEIQPMGGCPCDGTKHDAIIKGCSFHYHAHMLYDSNTEETVIIRPTEEQIEANLTRRAREWSRRIVVDKR